MVSRSIKTDELTLQIQDAGEGPLVILLHGFPDLSIGWQHQIKALAEAGYHAVAPDLRGYGGTGGPQTASAYSIFSLVGDVVALVEALGETRAVVIGHDWGAALAWHCALPTGTARSTPTGSARAGYRAAKSLYRPVSWWGATIRFASMPDSTKPNCANGCRTCAV